MIGIVFIHVFSQIIIRILLRTRFGYGMSPCENFKVSFHTKMKFIEHEKQLYLAESRYTFTERQEIRNEYSPKE